MAKHSEQTPALGIHIAIRWDVADAAARAALTLTDVDVGGHLLQRDIPRLFTLVAATPAPVWHEHQDSAELRALIAAKADDADLVAAVQTLDQAIIDAASPKADKATTISTPAGSGLSGGGNLGASRSLAADLKSVHGRIGDVVGVLGDYAASLIANNSTQISPATYPTVADALDRLATLIAGAGGAVTNVFGRVGAIAAQAADYAAFYVPLTRTITTGAGLSGGGDLTADRTLSADVRTVHTRTGNIVGVLGDYAASLVSNDSGVAGATVKAALDALLSALGSKADSSALGDKADKTITISAGAGLSGGGDLSANRTLSALVTSVFGRTGDVTASSSDIANAATHASLPPATYTTVTAALDRLAALITGAGGAVSDVFGRVGSIAAQASDYAAFYVPLTRTISAGTGLSGGGDLSANRTLSVVRAAGDYLASQVSNDSGHASLPAGTYAYVSQALSRLADLIATNTSAISGKADASALSSYVPTTRTVTAGAGLSGGGDLSANRTLSALVTSVFGRTGAITAAASDVANDASHASILPATYATVAAVLNQLATLIATNSANIALKADVDFTIVTISATTYTLTLADAGKLLVFTNAAGCVVTVPTNASVPFGRAVINLLQYAVGQVTITLAAGVTPVSSATAPYKTAIQYGNPATLVRMAAVDTWWISGGLA